MKETDQKPQDKIENVKQQSIELQKIKIGEMRPKKNHTLFEFNIVEKSIEEAKFDNLSAIKFEDAMNGNTVSQKKVTKKENCIYITALNKKNVIKILRRDFGITYF
jgi:anti-sigma factor ChrR (cupin superfamily)